VVWETGKKDRLKMGISSAGIFGRPGKAYKKKTGRGSPSGKRCFWWGAIYRKRIKRNLSRRLTRGGRGTDLDNVLAKWGMSGKREHSRTEALLLRGGEKRTFCVLIGNRTRALLQKKKKEFRKIVK